LGFQIDRSGPQLVDFRPLFIDFEKRRITKNMHLARKMIEYKASDDFSDRQAAFPTDPREAYRQGLDDGEILFARRLRAALKKQSEDALLASRGKAKPLTATASSAG
jgi:hypothetical protein